MFQQYRIRGAGSARDEAQFRIGREESVRTEMTREGPMRGEPLFMIPRSVVLLVASLVAIHIVRGSILSMGADLAVLRWFAFIPLRYDPEILGNGPGGFAADVWTFVSYAFLHGSMAHLLVNVLWLLAFGTAVARRFGPGRFLIFSGLCAAAGAALHLAFYYGDITPVVGASAAISGQMAAASRFVFDRDAPLGALRGSDPNSYRRPAAPLHQVFMNYRALTFVLVWFAINLFIGLGAPASLTGGASVAWEAHIGGFLFGLLAFPLFDPVERRRW